VHALRFDLPGGEGKADDCRAVEGRALARYLRIFREVVVITSKPLRPRRGEIGDVRYLARVVAPGQLFGTRRVWRDQTPVDVSGPSRTIVDVLDVPALGGGIRHVADVVRAHFASEHRDDRRLIGYGRRVGNQTVFTRLGFLSPAAPHRGSGPGR
jgi:predicted transcriptional regulator of viral defense system